MSARRLKAFGKSVREIRKNQGLSQEALASKAKVDRSYMGRVERGEKNLTFIMICRIADALGVKPKDLFPQNLRRSDFDFMQKTTKLRQL